MSVIAATNNLENNASEVIEDKEISSSVLFIGDSCIETLGGSTVQYCVELGMSTGQLDNREEDLKGVSERKKGEGQIESECNNDDVRSVGQKQGEKCNLDSHSYNTLHRQYYISLPLPLPSSTPLTLTSSPDTLALNVSLSHITLVSSTAHTQKPQNNCSESADIAW